LDSYHFYDGFGSSSFRWRVLSASQASRPAAFANGVRFFAPPYWKIEQCAKRVAANPYYRGERYCLRRTLVATAAICGAGLGPARLLPQL
jgi:hypothetical protein